MVLLSPVRLCLCLTGGLPHGKGSPLTDRYVELCSLVPCVFNIIRCLVPLCSIYFAPCIRISFLHMRACAFRLSPKHILNCGVEKSLTDLPQAPPRPDHIATSTRGFLKLCKSGFVCVLPVVSVSVPVHNCPPLDMQDGPLERTTVRPSACQSDVQLCRLLTAILPPLHLHPVFGLHRHARHSAVSALSTSTDKPFKTTPLEMFSSSPDFSAF